MSLLLALLLPQVVAPQLPAAKRALPPHSPSYVATQSGLAQPTFEGGRTEFECADVDGDGHVDLASVGDHGSPLIGSTQHGIMIWRGDGARGWSLAMSGDFGYGGIAIGDVNGDGLADVGYGVHHAYAAGDLGDQLLEVALGDGTGTAWTPWDDGLASTGETWGMFGTDFGDVDGDGDLDVGSNSFGCCAGIRVYANERDGTWTPSFVGAGVNSDMDLSFCDLDGDGHLDLAASNSAGIAYRGDGSGAFAPAGLVGTDYAGLSVGDVDGDGADEIATVTGGQPHVRRWSAGDVWTDLVVPAGPGTYERTQLCDLDVDGDLDLAAFGRGTLSWWLGDGAGSFGAPESLATPGANTKYAEAFEASADLDHNGYPDLLVLQDESGLFTGGHNELYAVYETSTPTKLTAQPLIPRPNATWRGGQARFVTWASAVPDAILGLGAGAGIATIELSTSGRAGPWIPLASAVPNSGRAQIVVPSGIASSDCFLRVSVLAHGATATGTSFGAFRLLP